MSIGMRLRFAAVVTMMLLAPIVQAAEETPDIRLGAPFADNAVVQREMKVPVWGWSEPGTKITVQFAGQKKSATAGEDGKWMLKLDPLKASFEPREMVIRASTGKTVTLKNLLVGEVWMASGQSNMQWKVGKSTAKDLKVEPVGDQKVAPIRECEVTSVYSVLHPIKKAAGSWENGDYGGYSAISFAFAHKLYEEVGVPIGILNTAFSTTKIQAWVPRVGFRDGDSEYTRAIYQDILKTDPRTPEHEAAWSKFYEDIEDALEEGRAISTDVPGNMNDNRDDTWMFNGRVSPVAPYAIRGAIWNQGWASQGEGLRYYNNLHSLVRGWRLVWDEPDLPVYFHQFYSNSVGEKPAIGGAADMRLGTWLARDIPNADMACQIDIGGAIHYRHKTVPAQRLARQALKNQYGRDIVANGPMFEEYEVKGNRLILEFEHAHGGLVVADPSYNATERHEDSTGFADPKTIENGEDQVELFYVADKNRVWHPAEVEIDGDKAIVNAPGVDEPQGVSYATGGVGFQPNLYNKALLPMTPFIVYNHELVTAENWPDEKLEVAGEKIDPSKVGKLYEYRKMPLLSTQFRDNAVLQAGQPVTIWGGAVHPHVLWGAEEMRTEGDAVVHFSFNGIEKDIPVTDDMMEWQVTVPPMEASAEPKTLKVTFTIDGELVHERVQKNIVVGDVWYVAAPAVEMDVPEVEPSGQIVRMIEREAKRDSNGAPSRYSICVSTTPENRFASYWKEAEGLAGALGNSIAAKTGKPVGIVFMKPNEAKELKHWIHPEYLDEAPSLMADYKDLAAARPGNKYYRANALRYMAAWKDYWNDYIPEMIETKAVPDGASWGWYPRFTSNIESTAGQVYNVMVHSFTPAALKGIIFIAGEKMVEEEEGANFGEQLSALANCWKEKFAGEDPYFIYTLPVKDLAPELSKPKTINGKNTAVETGNTKELMDKLIEVAYDAGRIDEIKAYCLDFNWGKRRRFAQPGAWSGADPAKHVAWYKTMGVNVIQTFCVSGNGYAWYKNGVVPAQPGLEHDFLPEVVRLGHREGMLVMGYFCIGANTRWGRENPELSYGAPSTYHIPYTDQYLAYLSDAIGDAVSRTGIDGFMIDWLWQPKRKSTGGKWLESEKKLYQQLMGEPFPGENKLTEAQNLSYSRMAIDRCWETIRKAAKTANPKCLLWLTVNDVDHPHVVNSDMYKEVDWLMNEAGDLKAINAVKSMVGRHTRLITCLARWNHMDAAEVVPAALKVGVGLYGFTKPRNKAGLVPLKDILSRPVDQLKGDNRNLAVLARAYNRKTDEDN